MAVTKKRHLLKAFTWRVVASFTTFILSWMLTGDPKIGLSIGVFDFLVKIGLYYAHERAWHKTKWGVEKCLSSK